MANSNVKVEAKGGNLIVTIPMEKNLKPSKSGKTIVVASTRGNIETGVKVNERNVIIGFNAYIYAKDKE